eukprot:1972028-Karenia_brevis.AAC.1
MAVEELRTTTQAACLVEATEAHTSLLQAGASEAPSWSQAAEGARPPQPEVDMDTAYFERGWQGYASS